MRPLLIASLAALLVGTASSQTGSFVKYGAGCPGSGGGNFCLSSNPNGGTLNLTQDLNTFALPADTTKPTVVLGFELYTQAMRGPITLQCQILDATATNAPSNNPPLRTGTMAVGTSPGWYRVTFQSLVVQANKRFFLSYTSPQSKMRFPIVRGGTKSTHYWRPPNQTAWRGPSNTLAWAWRVVCAGGSNVPAIGNTGVPTIGKRFSVDLANAKPTTAAGLLLGISRLNIDLTRAGAPGCFLLASLEVILAAPVDASGKGRFSLPIPASASLVGLMWHDQWLVLDAAANALRIAFSDGAKVTVGR